MLALIGVLAICAHRRRHPTVVITRTMIQDVITLADPLTLNSGESRIFVHVSIRLKNLFRAGFQTTSKSETIK
jgi:hypothetical protein